MEKCKFFSASMIDGDIKKDMNVFGFCKRLNANVTESVCDTCKHKEFLKPVK
ncbi:MAG: hypothetical protein ACTSWY_08145 [Promethearchaeota archaeon]